MANLGEQRMKDILTELAKAMGSQMGFVAEQQVVKALTNVSAGKGRTISSSLKGTEIVLTITGVSGVGDSRLFAQRMDNRVTINGNNSITITIPNDKSQIEQIRSGKGGVNFGNYVEALFQRALLERMVMLLGTAHIENKGFYNNSEYLQINQAITDMDKSISKAHAALKAKLQEAANIAAEKYVSTYLQNFTPKMMESFLQQLTDKIGSVQGGFGRNTTIGDVVGKGGANFPARIIEVKNYSFTGNSGIKYMDTSDKKLFGVGGNEYLKFLVSKSEAFVGFSDPQFLQVFQNRVGNYVHQKLATITGSRKASDHLLHLMKKQRVGGNLSEDAIAADLVNKVVVVISPDGTKVLVSGPLSDIYKRASSRVKFTNNTQDRNPYDLVDKTTGEKLMAVRATSESLQQMKEICDNTADLSFTKRQAIRHLDSLHEQHTLGLKVEIYPALLRLSKQTKQY